MSTLKNRGAKASPARTDLAYLSNLAGDNDGYLGLVALFGLMGYLVGEDDEIAAGDLDLSFTVKGNFFHVLIKDPEDEENPIEIFWADQTGFKLKVPLLPKSREITDSDESTVLTSDSFVSYNRTDEADLAMPSGGDMNAGQLLTVFNVSAASVDLKETVGPGFLTGAGLSDTFTLAAGKCAVFAGVNKPGSGGVLGVVSVSP